MERINLLFVILIVIAIIALVVGTIAYKVVIEKQPLEEVITSSGDNSEREYCWKDVYEFGEWERKYVPC